MSFLEKILIFLGLIHEDRPGLLLAEPIEISLYAGDDATAVTLIVLGKSGEVARELAAPLGVVTENGYVVFQIHPAEMPNPTTLRMRSQSGETFIGGPFDPLSLSEAISKQSFDTVDALLGRELDPPATPSG